MIYLIRQKSEFAKMENIEEQQKNVIHKLRPYLQKRWWRVLNT